MSRWFCFGKKDFCDDIENCRFCKFADGTGSVSEDEIGLILSGIFGEDYDLNHLKKLVEADREGRCVVLPCKVGDVVYVPDRNNMKVLKKEVRQVSFNHHGKWVVFVGCIVVDIGEIGKTVFLTREEAEAALEKMKEGDK